MAFKILMRKNDTGEEKLIDVDLTWYKFPWSEGNFSCDCNRDLYWHNWEGYIDDTCGEERYTIVHAVLDDGSIVLVDERG